MFQQCFLMVLKTFHFIFFVELKLKPHIVACLCKIILILGVFASLIFHTENFSVMDLGNDYDVIANNKQFSVSH